MNPDPSKLRQQHEQVEQTASLHAPNSNSTRREFGSVEELIRFDAAQTPAPGSIADRLRESISAEPRPKASWWRRFLGRFS